MITPTERMIEKYMDECGFNQVTAFFYRRHFHERTHGARQLYNYMIDLDLRPRTLKGCRMLLGLHNNEYMRMYRAAKERKRLQQEQF